MRYTPYIRHVDNASCAVLFIHGFAGTPVFFRDLLPAVPDNCSIYNILLDGHGKAPRDMGHSSMAIWRQEVYNWVDKLLLTHEKLVVVGYSLGNLLSIQVAADYPEKVSALFMVDAPLIPRVPLSTITGMLRIAKGELKPGTLEWKISQVLGIHLPIGLGNYLSLAPRFWELWWECRRAKKAMPRLHTKGICCQPVNDELVHSKVFDLIRSRESLKLVMLPDSSHFIYAPEDMARMADLLRQQLNAL